MDMRVQGASELSQLAGRLQAADKGIRRGLNKTLRTTAKKLVPKIVDAAVEKFPAAGGMNDFIHQAKIGVRIQSSGKSAGLFIRAERKGHDIYALNDGRLRHPLFGNRGFWFEQAIPPGFFTETIENHKAEITAELLAEMRAFAASLGGDRMAASTSNVTAERAARQARAASFYKSVGAI